MEITTKPRTHKHKITLKRQIDTEEPETYLMNKSKYRQKRKHSTRKMGSKYADKNPHIN